MDPRPVLLEGVHARLEPLEVGHAEDLAEAGADPSIWTWMPRLALRDAADARAMIVEALEAARDGSQVPFALIERGSGRAVGSTRYLDVRRAHRGLEIGWTWIAPRWQRTALNTEAKRLLLAHAFEELGALRVQLKTDHWNERSQRAIERLGAKREGVLRAHMVRPDGSLRDTVMYSIVAEEWAGVRDRLDRMLARECLGGPSP